MVCILETLPPGCNTMQTNTIIENLVSRELRAIIQCELSKLDQEHIMDSDATRGLCRSCDHALHCTLPGRKDGVWRCPEFSE